MGWFDDNAPGGSSSGGGTTQPGLNTTGLVQHGTPNADGTWTVNGQILTPPQYAQFVQSGTLPTAAPAGAGASAGGGTSAPTPVSASNGDIASQVAAYFQARGVTPNPTSVQYWAQRWNEFGAKDPAYFNTRLSQADEFGGGGAGGAGGGGYLGGGGMNMGTFTLPDAAALGAGAGLWNGTGTSSLASLAAQGLTDSPGYQFRLQQGIDALQRGAAAKGTLLTGGTAKALDRYGQDYAANEYQNQYNRLLGEQTTGYGQRLGAAQLGLQGQGQYANQLYGLTNLGMNAAGQQANLGAGYAGQAGNLLSNQATNTTNLVTGAGNAQSAGTIAAANAWAQALQNIGNAGTNAAQQYYLYQLMQGRTGGGGLPGYGPLAPGYAGSTTQATVPPYLAAV